jgi:hypothetical protein
MIEIRENSIFQRGTNEKFHRISGLASIFNREYEFVNNIKKTRIP